MNLTIPFQNSYARLPERFYSRQLPRPVANPRLLALNRPLATELGINPDALATEEGVAVLAGNNLPEGAEPLAQAYAGHQFGNWVPSLGDGRALLLGEVVTTKGERRDIQLKGAGRTAFSRGGDGRAWMGPVLREYLVSEAMHALGLPTTRALAAVATGEDIQRETLLPGAILTRVAASHLRIGTFQYFAARGDSEALQLLTEHALARHYPAASDAMGLLRGVTKAQAQLVAGWMSFGFIHGVMNTDNMSISGETIDYGPCAFMDEFHPSKVFSSIDRHGRYAWGNQPQIAVWNLSRLASALLPLMGGEAAIPEATSVIESFADCYEQEFSRRFSAKLALNPDREGDVGLAYRLLDLMAEASADFTVTFRALAEDRPTGLEAFPGFADWKSDWLSRRQSGEAAFETMRAASPAIIPRNHQVEHMIAAAVAGDMRRFQRLSEALSAPYADQDDEFRAPPRPAERVLRTFCGT